jgi:Zn-dependent oligopeptidase
MEKNIKNYIFNVKNSHLLLGNINKDILLLNKKLELLKDVNNVRLDEKYTLLDNIINNKVQIGGSGVSENLQMNDDLDLKIQSLQDKVDAIRKKASKLHEITKLNISKTESNIQNIISLNDTIDGIIGDPQVTEQITENANKLTSYDYTNLSNDELFKKVVAANKK